MSLLRGYRVGGTLHIIVNNQVGFTTDPIDARSTHYASDLAKGFEMPIVHVNADDAEACMQAVRLGDRVSRSVQQGLPDRPRRLPPSRPQRGRPAGVHAADAVQDRSRASDAARGVGRAARARARGHRGRREGARRRAVARQLEAIYRGDEEAPARPTPSARRGGARRRRRRRVDTAVRAEQLVALNEQLLQLAVDVQAASDARSARSPRRRDAIDSGGIDWGHAEALAFGVAARRRRRRAHHRAGRRARHVLAPPGGAARRRRRARRTRRSRTSAAGDGRRSRSTTARSSETAVLGFEYGFSIAAPRRRWCCGKRSTATSSNVAQPIIDQFISADRAKWGQDSGSCCCCRTATKGRGPEHSSARLERFLQLCAEGNMVVAYPSTPAQYFHILRRQALRAAAPAARADAAEVVCCACRRRRRSSRISRAARSSR